MKRLRWPLLIALLALVIIAALLMREQPVLVPVLPVVEPATGGVYVEGLVGSFVRLNPLLDYYNKPDRDVDRLIFSGLLHFDDRGQPQKDLADSWGISQDGTVYNFSLRADAVWHDGNPVKSDDVIFTIERMREDGSLLPDDLRELWRQVEVRRLDDKMLQFRLPEPYSPFLDYLTFGIVPEHLYGDLILDEIIDSPLNMQPVGSGPYRFNQLIIENGQIVGVALSAFSDYYGAAPFIEQIAFRYYPDATAALAAYRSGETLGIGDVGMDILPEVLAEPKLNLHTGRLPEMSLLLLNLGQTQLPFLQQAEIRHALMSGLNRQWMVDRLLGGQAIVADGPIFPGTWAYYERVEHISYEPEAAIEVLKQAGFTMPADGSSARANQDGVKLSFELLYPDDEKHRLLAEAIQRDWGGIGVSVTLKPVTYEDLLGSLEQRSYQVALVDLNLSRSPDPDPYPFWHQAQTVGGQNYSMWDDRQASEYLEQARIMVDQAERARLYRNFQVRFAEDLPALPLFYPVYRYAVDQQVLGVSMGPLFDTSDRFNIITKWYLITKKSSGTATPAATNTAP